MEKVKPSLIDIKREPSRYRLGIVPAQLYLPRKEIKNPNGVTIQFSPEESHRKYLMRSNAYPIRVDLEGRKSIYAKNELEDGRQILLTSVASPYTTEGDHLVVWCPRGDGFRFQETFLEMSREQGEKAFEVVAGIASIYDNVNGGRNYFIGINVQPDEFERQSVQSIRDAVHLHLVRLDDKDIESFKEVSSNESLAMFADRYTGLSIDLFEQLIARRIMELPGRESVIGNSIKYRDYPFNYPKAHFFELKDGWNTLALKQFFPFIQEIQKIIIDQYEDLVKSFTDGRREKFRAHVKSKNSGEVKTEPEIFRRFKPVDREEIIRRMDEYLKRHPEIDHAETVERLSTLARIIKPASEILEKHFHNYEDGVPVVSARVLNQKIIMEGVSYNILFFPDPTGKRVLMAFAPRVTSAASPLDSFGIEKRQYVLDEEQFNLIMASTGARYKEITAQLLRSLPYLQPGK